MAFRELFVVFDLRRLEAGGYTAIDPIGRIEQAARMRHLLGREHLRDFYEHPGIRTRTLD
jgi:hypothetical protein